MKNKYYLNLPLSIQMIFLLLFFCLLTLFGMNSITNKVGLIVFLAVFLSFIALSMICIMFFGFHSVCLTKDYVIYKSLLKQTKIPFADIEKTYVIKTATIYALCRTVQFEDTLVVCANSKKIKLPLSRFEYNSQNNSIVYKIGQGTVRNH